VRGSQALGASVNYSPEFISPEPNVNLLRRIAESAGGKVIDPASPEINPFLHDRKKTYQPNDFWEWLLRFAVILFTLDVGVRRIQIERDEFLKAVATLRRWILFWEPAPRAPEAEVSLAALLARRDEVRSRQPVSTEPKADLFQPEKQVAGPLPGLSAEPATAEEASPAPGAEPPSPEAPAAPASTTSRLLEAKKRAQKRK
jgi:hypothetical protein